MSRYPRTICLLATPPPDLAAPDYPPGCVAAPVDYVRLGYCAAHDAAQARLRARQRQRWCVRCERWRWGVTPCSEPTNARPPRRTRRLDERREGG